MFLSYLTKLSLFSFSAQAIWRFVMQKGFKTHFSYDIRFATFIKCAIGLSFIPLDRIQDGLDVLHGLGVALPRKYHGFVDKFLRYYEKVWIFGNYPPEEWNYYHFIGSNTNNHQEGFNRKLSGEVLGTKPNPYKAVAKLKELFIETTDNAEAIKQSTFGKKQRQSELSRRREKQMDKIEISSISLDEYLISIGQLSFHFDQQRITKPKPVESSSDEECDDDESSIMTIDRIVLPEDFMNFSQYEFRDKSLKKRSRKPSKKKSKSKKSPKDVPVFNTSAKGAELREKRKKIQREKREQKVMKNLEAEWEKQKSKENFLPLLEGIRKSGKRLQELNFILSPTQPITPGDGDCFVHAILDQLQYDPGWKSAKLTITVLREKVTALLIPLISGSGFEWDEAGMGPKENWIVDMAKSKKYVDHYFIELISEFLNRQIVIYPLFDNEGWKDGKMVINPYTQKKPNGTEPLYLLYFSELVFEDGAHYQSIRPKPDNQEPEGSNISYQNDGIPDKSDLPRPRRNPGKPRKPVESCNISNGEFPLPQAESTSINSNSTASTEPPEELQSIQDVTEPYIDPSKWAHLASMSDKKFNSVDIFDDTFQFGKKNNSYLVKDPEIEKSVSNHHFMISRIEKKAYIFDLSTYGTYLNGVLIGKGKSRDLDHTDRISILNKDLNAFSFVRLEKAYQPNDLTKEYLLSSCNYTVQENDESTVKKSKPTVKGSKSSKIPKPNNQEPEGLNISYQNDGIPDISDLPKPKRNPVKHRKPVQSCNISIETSPEPKKTTRSSLKTKSKLKNKVDVENIIPTKRSRK